MAAFKLTEIAETVLIYITYSPATYILQSLYRVEQKNWATG